MMLNSDIRSENEWRNKLNALKLIATYAYQVALKLIKINFNYLVRVSPNSLFLLNFSWSFQICNYFQDPTSTFCAIVGWRRVSTLTSSLEQSNTAYHSCLIDDNSSTQLRIYKWFSDSCSWVSDGDNDTRLSFLRKVIAELWTNVVKCIYFC